MVGMKYLQAMIDKSIYLFQLLQKFNIFRNFNVNTRLRNLNRLFLNNPKKLFLSFSEQNIYKNHDRYFTNFKKLEIEELGLNHTKQIQLKNNLNSISLIDLDTIVPNDYLIRSDKIFMNSGVEVRVPLLDVNLINNFLMMSSSKKFGYKFDSKSLLKRLFKKDIHSLVKNKWGMQSPIGKWMKDPLQNYIKDILSPDYYNSSNFFNFKNIRKLVLAHKEKYQNPELIWSLVMMQIFLKKYKF